jgi:LmbE family N-acetylglucosaminyl deacetylase
MNLPLFKPSLLQDPVDLPLRSINTIASGLSLVVAPHPDDETLGCGGAIALLRALGHPVHVLVMSDGTLSHPRSLRYPARRLKAVRAAETLEALSILGVAAPNVTFLGLPDGSIPTLNSPQLHAAVARCCTHLQALQPRTIWLPLQSDPHPDHRATWRLIQAALMNLHLSPRIIEYPIWDWDLAQRGEFSNTSTQTAWRLDIQAVLPNKLKAIAAYRSQTTDLINDDPEGFRLTPDMLANFERPWELYMEEIV